MKCTNYLPGDDLNGNRCQYCNVLPINHADPFGCKGCFIPPGSGSCVCGKAGCQHPREMVKTQKALSQAAKQKRLF